MRNSSQQFDICSSAAGRLTEKLSIGLGILLLAGGLVQTLSQSAHAAGVRWRSDYAAARAEAQRLNRPLVVHFSASWCGPCRRMDRDVLSSPELAGRLQNQVVGVKIDADQRPDLCKQFGVRSLPADAVVAPDGTVLSLTFGYQPKPRYLAGLNRAAARIQVAPANSQPDTLPNLNPTDTQLAKTSPDPEPKPTERALRIEPLPNGKKPKVGLDGFCPVSLWTWREWKQGERNFAAGFKGERYHFATEELRDKFIKDPERYVPRLVGCDPVVLDHTDRAVRGSTRFGAYFEGQLYLFISPESRAAFREDPARYTKTRHVLKIEQDDDIRRE